jgi:hypothetical protein
MCTDKNILNIFSKTKIKLYLYCICKDLGLCIRINSIKNLNFNILLGIKKKVEFYKLSD